jgi:FkbM family methyltransferase
MVKNIKLYGTKYGGFYLPEDISMPKNPVIYSFGVGEDITFDVFLANKFNSKIHLFDPTPRAKEHVNVVKKFLKDFKEPEYDKRIGGGYKKYWKMILEYKTNPDNLIMNDYGLHIKNGNFKFYSPANKDFVSHSVVSGVKSDSFINVEMKNLKTIMRKKKHDKIDFLKIDVEFLENDVLNNMLDLEVFPKFVCVDFDSARARGKWLEIANNTIKRMVNNGYTILYNDDWDITFELEK